MPYNESLAARVRTALEKRGAAFEEKLMMGGLCFMVNGKMCVGIEGDRLMARVGPEAYSAALQRKGCCPMDFTGRPMRGFVFVEPDGLGTGGELSHWITLALEFNPRATSSKTRTTSAGRRSPRSVRNGKRSP